MKKMKKILVASVLMLSFMLSACAKEFDASGYVKASLEASLYSKYDAYAKFRNISKEKAQEEVEDDLLDEFETGMDELGFTDAQELAYAETFRTCLSKAKFEVGEATKDKAGNYTVPVTCEPMDTIQRMTDELAEELAERMDVLEDQSKFADFVIEHLEKLSEEVSYGEKVTTNVRVEKDDATYEIADEDYEKLLSAMIAQ